jgi:hypothetical protein
MDKTNVIEKCEGCLNVRKDNKCDVIIDPQYMWREGHKCWAFNDSPDIMLGRLREILKYNEDKGVDTNSLNAIKKEMDEYAKELNK